MVTKKKTKFFKSLRFRILVILLILGIVPSVIVTQLMISNYEKQAIEVKVSEVSTQCAILCNQIIKENYLNDSSSQSVNSKLELLSNVYGGRMVIVDRDLKVVADTYHVDEGRTLIAVTCCPGDGHGAGGTRCRGGDHPAPVALDLAGGTAVPGRTCADLPGAHAGRGTSFHQRIPA